jgi:hypothetical protein
VRPVPARPLNVGPLGVSKRAFMLKLYNRADDGFRYHEAWQNGSTIYEHWGLVGERGDTREHRVPKGKSAGDAIIEVLNSAGVAGFRPIDMEDHNVLLIEYPINGMGNLQDLSKRHALEERMSETLGWTGLGMCDGGSIGSGTMEVCCLVVDFDIAKRVIEADLAGTEFSDYSRIYNESEYA